MLYAITYLKVVCAFVCFTGHCLRLHLQHLQSSLAEIVKTYSHGVLWAICLCFDMFVLVKVWCACWPGYLPTAFCLLLVCGGNVHVASSRVPGLLLFYSSMSCVWNLYFVGLASSCFTSCGIFCLPALCFAIPVFSQAYSFLCNPLK